MASWCSIPPNEVVLMSRHRRGIPANRCCRSTPSRSHNWLQCPGLDRPLWWKQREGIAAVASWIITEAPRRPAATTSSVAQRHGLPPSSPMCAYRHVDAVGTKRCAASANLQSPNPRARAAAVHLRQFQFELRQGKRRALHQYDARDFLRCVCLSRQRNRLAELPELCCTRFG